MFFFALAAAVAVERPIFVGKVVTLCDGRFLDWGALLCFN